MFNFFPFELAKRSYQFFDLSLYIYQVSLGLYFILKLYVDKILIEDLVEQFFMDLGSDTNVVTFVVLLERFNITRIHV